MWAECENMAAAVYQIMLETNKIFKFTRHISEHVF